MNLLNRKSQLGLAHDGVGLLKQKREVLLSKFMELIKPLMEKHELLHREMVQAFHCLNTARSIDGWDGLKSALLQREHGVGVEITSERKWGVDIPRIESVEGLGPDVREPHSLSTSLRIFETRDRFEKILSLIFEFAPLETALKRLGREIQKTTRRINALELSLIPGLQHEIRSIANTLEEREREDSFRLRRIKDKKGVKRR